MEDYYTHRNSGHRYLIQKIDDSKPIQLVDGNGLADEQHTQIMRVYPHGFSSHSIKDSHMLAIGLGGRRDLLVALGGENDKKRPKNLPQGDTILYNAEGDAIRLFGKKTLDITHAKNIKMSIGQGLADSESDSGQSGGQGGQGGQDKGKEAKAGKDKDVTIVMTEKDITITKGKTSVKLEANLMTLTQGGSNIKIEDAKITLNSKHIVLNADRVDLGGEGGDPVANCGIGCSEIVYSI